MTIREIAHKVHYTEDKIRYDIKNGKLKAEYKTPICGRPHYEIEEEEAERYINELTRII